MKKLRKQSILYSDRIINLAKEFNEEDGANVDILDEQQYEYVTPRIFPNPKIPAKVAVFRKTKQFFNVDLNSILKGVEWHEDSEELRLSNFIFGNDYAIQYGCSEQQISQNKVKSRAYCSSQKSFQTFTIQNYNRETNCFDGSFYIKQPEEKKIQGKGIPRQLICFDFEDPIVYSNQVIQGEKRRKKVIDILKYQFYVDNMDFEGAPLPSHKIINKIKQLSCAYINRHEISEKNDLSLVVSHYKRVMNEILFRHEARIQNLSIYIPTKYQRKEEKPHNLKRIKVKKGDKVVVLIPKTVSQRLEILKTKTLFINENITSILHFLKQKFMLKPRCPLFLQIKQTAFERYLLDQQASIEYCYSAFNQFIVDPLATEIRGYLVERPDGWFRVYEQSRLLYLESKLRKMFVLIHTLLRDWIVDQIEYQFGKFLEFLRNWTPRHVYIETVHQNKVFMKDSFFNKKYVHIISIELIIYKGKLKLSHESAKIKRILKKLISDSLQKFSRIPTPEPIVLKQLFGGYKNQQGIKVDLSMQENSDNINRYPRINQLFLQLNQQIDKICQALEQYEAVLQKTEEIINMKQLYEGRAIKCQDIKEVIEVLKQLNKLQEVVMDLFKSDGSCIGFFLIKYQIVKIQLLEMINLEKEIGRKKLIVENKRMNMIYHQKVIQIQRKLIRKPKNVQELVQKQNLMKNLKEILGESTRQSLQEIRQLCYGFQIKVDPQQRKMQIQTQRIIAILYKNTRQIEKQYQDIKKEELRKIKNTQKDIQESLTLLQITAANIANEDNLRLQNYEEYAHKVIYIKNHLSKFTNTLKQAQQKEQLLGQQNSSQQLQVDLITLQQQVQPYELLWVTLDKWKKVSRIWYDEPIGSYQLKEPQIILKGFVTNLKKAVHIFLKKQKWKLKQAADKLKQEIEQFEPKLQLLRILKKKGLTRKHLQQLGIQLKVEIQSLTLREALKLGMFEKLQQIETISNEAWNKFSLELTLQRLRKEIYELKFKLGSYQDRRKNEILMILNYKQLIQAVETILSNIEAVQFNPLVKMFEAQIKQIYDRSLYISKSLNISQEFQKLLIEMHPIFDSTDIVKQIPSENKKFGKVLRIWLQMLAYIKNIVSVNDSSSTQNMYQKIKSLLTTLESVKKELVAYLQQKRKGFSRFYLLSNSQLFALFSATSDINSVNALIPKLFQSISSINVELKESKIKGVSSTKHCVFNFYRPITFKGVNIQNWLVMFENEIKYSVKRKTSELIQSSLKQPNWLKIIQQQGSIPQIVFLLYEILTTLEIENNFMTMQKLKQKNLALLHALIDRKKQQQSKPLTVKSDTILCSVIIIIMSKLNIFDRFIKLNVQSQQDFQWKKLIKSIFVHSQDDFAQFKIQTLNFQSPYGYEFLGIFSRLVITNLTQKMQIIYFLSQKYSLGGAAVGPAGTGKSETTKDIAKLVGKTCLIFNCSENFHQSTFLRLIKGMVITGLWMCFDEFNRLDHKILSIAADHLSYLLKFRSYGYKVEFSFLGQSIWMNPTFQFCITYNPTYQGRRSIPKNLNQLFRTVAMVLPDEYTICLALLYSNGYSKGQKLAKNIMSVFKSCRQIWSKQQNYDFGLRALRGIINMSSGLLLSGKENQQNSIIQSLKMLNSPKMKKDDNEAFLKIVEKQFDSIVLPIQRISQQFSLRLSILKSILGSRDGVLLCGQPLSGKQQVLTQFRTKIKDWQVATLFHDVLSVDQLFGQLDPSTKLWRDGFFTSLVRANVQIGEDRPKFVIVLNGSVYSQWVQNLNSFLDSTRKLSLSSGQTISIPSYLKLVVSCTSLEKASPATITRFGIINYQPLKSMEVSKRSKIVPNNISRFFEELQLQIQGQLLANIDERFILNWVIDYLGVNQVNFDTFIFYLAQIYDGLLTKAGRYKFVEQCKKYLSVPYSPFQFMLKLNNEPVFTELQFKKFSEYEEESNQFVEGLLTFEEIFIPTPRSFKVQKLIQHFVSNSGAKRINKLFVIFGQRNVGKTRITHEYFKKLAKEKYKTLSFYFTRKTNNTSFFTQFYSKLTKKTHTKLGADPGISLNVWVEDINMPTNNNFDIIQTSQLFRLLCSESQWYNYNTFSKQSLQDIVVMADGKTTNFGFKNPLNLGERLYRHIVPIFLGPVDRNELEVIFNGIIKKSLSIDTRYSGQKISSEMVDHLKKLSKKTIQIYECLQKQNDSNNLIPFTLNDLYKSLKGFLKWKLPQSLKTVSEVLEYQLGRNLASKLISKEKKVTVLELIASYFLSESKYKQQLEAGGSSAQRIKFPLFHNLENTNTSWDKCEKIENITEFTNRFQCICDQFKSLTNQNYSIIVFPQMIEYLVKVYRTLLIDYSHLAIVGLSKCGKNTIVKLASYLISSDIYRIKESNDNQKKDWEQGIKFATKNCYKSKNISFLVVRTNYLGFSWCPEDLNKLLNTMQLEHIYSEADIEQMIYMIQTELVKKNIPVNQDTMWIELSNYLKEKLRIVLLLNPSFNTVKGVLVQYPSIVKICTFLYIQKWPKDALYLIAKLELPNFQHSLDIFPEIHYYCQKICESSKLSLLSSGWEGMYFQFINCCTTIYEANQVKLTNRKKKYEQSLKIIEETQSQLEATKTKIKKLQPTIILLENQTSKTVKNLEIQRKYAQQTNQTLEIKNVELEKIIFESRTIKYELQTKLKAVDDRIQDAWKNVALLKPNHISEVKALANPSDFIKNVLAGLVILTFEGPLLKQMKEVNGHIVVQQSYFQTAKKYVLSKDSKAICRLLTEFKREYVTKQMFQRLEEKCLSYKRWSEKEAKNANKAIYYFFIWVDAVANQYRIYEQTQPLRNELERVSKILAQKEEEVAVIRKQLSFYYTKIGEYQEQLKIKREALQQYRLQIRKFERMLSRGQQLLTQIEGEKGKWAIYINEMQKKIRHNFGDSVVMAATIVYLSSHIYEIRRKIKQNISKYCKKYHIPISITGVNASQIAWYLSPQEQQYFQTLKIHKNEFLIDNIKITQNVQKLILLLDPQEQGINLIKQLIWKNLQAPIDKLTEYSPNLIRSIQSAILYGRVIFVEVDATIFNNSLRFLINPSYHFEDGQKYIKSGDKSIAIHENYRLYLYSTVYPQGKGGDFSMQLLTNIQLINFKMTSQQLEQRILEVIVNSQLPSIKAKIEEIYRVNIKDSLTLTDIEQKLLQMFSNELSVEQILQSDQIISTVVHSNRLYKQISVRIAQSTQQTLQIDKEKKPYLKKAHQVCLLYQSLNRLKLVSQLYSYSYQWFIELFQGNFYQFYQTLYRQVSKGLRKEEKIVVSILISQVIHPNLPWKALFNVEQSNITHTIYTTHETDSQQQEDQTEVNVLSKLMKTLGALPKQLPVSQNSWNNTISRIKKVKKYIVSIEDLFVGKPELFLELVICSEDRVLQALPDEYSNLDFFYKILVVSCFRPELVIGLLKQWIKINMGAAFIETQRNLASLYSNTKPYRPIITILPDTSIQSLSKIRDINKQFYGREDKDILINNFHFTKIQQSSQFDRLVKSSLIDNRWIIVESISSTQVLTFIKEYFEEMVLLPEKQFRLWIVMVDSEIDSDNVKIGERFTQFCDKIRITINRDIFKQISTSFNKYQDSLKKESDFFERSKKKLLISQLCIFHHLLGQFSQQYSFLSQIYRSTLNKPSSLAPIITLTPWDLKLVVQEIFKYKIQQYSKLILHNQLITNLTYDSQISSFYLHKFINVNCQVIINGVVIDRNALWQTLWCDQKFPKDTDEYQFEVKKIVKKKKYKEIFGLNNQLNCRLRQNQYKLICKFYEKTLFSLGRGVSTVILERIQVMKSSLDKVSVESLDFKVKQKLQMFKESQYFRCGRFKTIYQFVRIELQKLNQLFFVMNNDINFCRLALIQERQIKADSDLQKFMMNIYSNVSPWSQSHRPFDLIPFCQSVVNRYQLLSTFITNFNHVKNIIDCKMIENWSLFIQMLKQYWQIGKQVGKLKLVFVGLQKLDHLQHILAINGFQVKQNKDHANLTIDSLLATQAKQRGLLGFFLLKDLTLLNCEVETVKNQCYLKVNLISEEEDPNALIKGILNLGILINKNKKMAPDSQEKLTGIVFILADEQDDQKRKRLQKIIQLPEAEVIKLVPISCYENGFFDYSAQSDPIGTIYTLIQPQIDSEKAVSEIQRQNIHFCLKP